MLQSKKQGKRINKQEADRQGCWGRKRALVLGNATCWRRNFYPPLARKTGRRAIMSVVGSSTPPFLYASLSPARDWQGWAKSSRKSPRIDAEGPAPSPWQEASELVFHSDWQLLSAVQLNSCSATFFSLRTFFLFVNTLYVFDLLAFTRQSNMACQQFIVERETGRAERGSRALGKYRV